MRRVLAVAAVLAGAVAVAIASAGPVASGSSDYRVDALFDSAKGLISGNEVTIAGARVGTVTAIRLTAGYQARVEMTVDRRYAPFYANARCQIRPVALIGEMEVNCDPGGRRNGPLAGGGDKAPTVQLARTTVPVDFTDLFNIWSQPVEQRLSEALWTLGAATAGRGDDLNGILRRTNPALTLARESIATLNSHRAQLGELLSSGDRVLAAVAGDKDAVPRFIDHAAGVTTKVAAQRGALNAALRRLPRLLDTVDRTLPRLDAVTAQATPALRNLRAAAPGLARMTAELPPFARAARPALERLGKGAVAGRRSVSKLTPVIAKLRTFARASRPVAGQLEQLFTSMRTSGFVENLNSIPYYGAAALARFDKFSHIAGGNFMISACAGSSQSHLPGCAADNESTAGKPRRRGRAPARRPETPTPATASPEPTKPRLPKLPIDVPRVVGGVQDTVKNLLDYLLK